MTLISICIPAFNRVEFLPELLDSILVQEYSDYEIIVAEDHSPQRPAISATIASYIRCHGEKIRYYENPRNLGYDGNLRRLIELANGSYILFMGNDDLLATGALASIAEVLHKYSEIGVVLRSYSSFMSDPKIPVQVFRYFGEDRVFPPGPDTVVTFFRRSVFISGMVFKRSSAAACSTERFDGTLLYQQHLVGRILAKESGVYLNNILTYHRLGGVPDFGASSAEKGLFVPKQQTPDSSVNFMRGMIAIAKSLDEEKRPKVSHLILRDIGNYSYPILSIQSDRSLGIFLSYIRKLMQLGLWRAPLFYIYALGLIVIRRGNCDRFIARIKATLGRAPLLGRVYAGNSLNGRSD
jgi:abequosyltransferase